MKPRSSNETQMLWWLKDYKGRTENENFRSCIFHNYLDEWENKSLHRNETIIAIWNGWGELMFCRLFLLKNTRTESSFLFCFLHFLNNQTKGKKKKKKNHQTERDHRNKRKWERYWEKEQERCESRDTFTHNQKPWEKCLRIHKTQKPKVKDFEKTAAENTFF